MVKEAKVRGRKILGKVKSTSCVGAEVVKELPGAFEKYITVINIVKLRAVHNF